MHLLVCNQPETSSKQTHTGYGIVIYHVGLKDVITTGKVCESGSDIIIIYLFHQCQKLGMFQFL